MTGTTLSDQDKKNAYTLRWHTKYLLDNSTDKDCLNHAQDAFDLITDILEEGDEHIDVLDPNDEFKPVKEETEVSDRVYIKKPISGKVAIVIGHNKNTGASAHDGSDEWTTRKLVAEELQDYLGVCGIQSKIFIRNGKLSYGDAMREHGRNIDNYGADIAVELHFNSATPSSTGAEFICCSENGKKLAVEIVNSWKNYYPEMALRRDGGVWFRDSGRGVGFCRAPKAPAIVYEPFFASNPKDWVKFKGLVTKEAQALGNGLIEWFKKYKS